MTGTTLSHYRITAELGRGGMGIVYKARDTKLDRQVAIKVLPSSALASEDDRARFYREAKAAAALNHPNIAQIYQIDEAVPSDAPHGTQPSPFIAMEYIDGEPLDERIKRGPLKLAEAVRLATQIAGALGEAHEKGIVHRDVKASNVMLTSKGDAKVLDFGLALTAASTKLTRMGSTLGTVAYMSPEQARGEEVDKRTDLWALGVVLYEMVAGRNPFGGDYEQAVVYSIMNEHPEPLTAIRTGVPMELERIVGKALTKDASRRYQTAADLSVDLKNLDVTSASSVTRSSSSRTISHQMSAISGPPGSQPGATVSPETVGQRRIPWLWMAASLVAGMLLMLGALSRTGGDARDRGLTRVDIAMPELAFPRFPTMSPTGPYLAVQGASVDGQRGIFLREMKTGNIQYVRDSDNVGDREMGFSPDGQHLAYNAGTNGGLYVMEVPSGIPSQLTDYGRFAYWESDDVIVMTDDREGGGDFLRVSITDPEPGLIPVEDQTLPEGYINVLKTHVPGTEKAFGHRLVRIEGGGQDVSQPAAVFVVDVASGELNVIARNAINPYFVKPDFLAYQIGDDDGPLVVRRLNRSRDDFASPAVDAVSGESTSWGDYVITPRGDLMYLKSGGTSVLTNELWEVDLGSRIVRPLQGALPGNFLSGAPVVSPDERRLSFMYQTAGGTWNIHLYDLERQTTRQITFQEQNYAPSFNHGGTWIYWTQMLDSDQPHIARIPVDLSQRPEIFIDDAGGPLFSPDGRWMAYTSGPNSRGHLILRNLISGDEQVRDSTSALPLTQSFSPDSRYLAYSGDGSASAQVHIISVEGSERYEIPGVRAQSVRFSDDGQGLLIEAGSSLYRMPIRTQPSFSIQGNQELLLSTPYGNGFDVRGSDKLYISAAAVQFAGRGESNTSFVWMQNWSSHLQEELGE